MSKTKFTYTAMAADGSTVTGVESADDAAGARTALLERDLQPMELAVKKSIMQLEIKKKKVPGKDLMHFTRQMAVFVRAGIPILDALDVITEETTNKLLLEILQDMSLALRSGETFADAAERHPEAFKPFFVSFLRSAELTGNLDDVLEQLGDYIERDMDAKKRLTSAMVYPGIVMGMSLVTVIVLTVFVLPRFAKFFEQLDAKLPLATRILLAITDLMTKGWPIILGVFVALGVTLFLGLRTEAGRKRLDPFVLRVPVLGDLIRHSILERLCRILASMSLAGVALPDALTVASEATNNHVFKKGLSKVREQMIQGEGLAQPLAESGLLPGAARQMVKVGEETGTLGEQLESAAKYLDRELDYKIKNFVAMFEPMTIVFVGVVVGFVAVALVSAMYGVYNQVEV